MMQCQIHKKRLNNSPPAIGGLTCDRLQQSADVEQALLEDAPEAQAKDGDAGHPSQHQRPCSQEQHGRLPEATGQLSEGAGVGPTAHSHSLGPDAKAAAVQAERRPVFSGVHPRV